MSAKQSDITALLAQTQWHDERKMLRKIIRECGLEEAVKWGKLCYGYNGGNVAIIYGLKTYCAVGFFKGSLLRDKKNALVAPGKHSQAMRQMRFTGMGEILAAEADLKSYLKAAIEVEKKGLEVEFSEKHELTYPRELLEAFENDQAYATAFEGLTPGRKRGYIIHFSDAKHSSTRENRIRKCRSAVIEGKGVQER